MIRRDSSRAMWRWGIRMICLQLLPVVVRLATKARVGERLHMAQEIVRHSGIEVTMTMYAHTSLSENVRRSAN